MEWLCGQPLFADFSPDELEGTIRHSELRSYRPGEKIIHVGQAGSFLGVVLEGSARAQVRGADGRTQVLGEIAEGGYFGEISLVSGDPTTADIVAVTTCKILQIPHMVMSEALRFSSSEAGRRALLLSESALRTGTWQVARVHQGSW